MPKSAPQSRLRFKHKLVDYAQLLRLHKPVGILLLLWPTLWGLWVAHQGQPTWSILLIFSLGVIIMRSAGCAINDYADRDFDKHVSRTQDRPLTAGRISSKEALSVFAVLLFLALLLVMQLNLLTIAMSVVAALLAISYPYMKRYHYFPQVHLGAAFAWAIPMAYTAIHNSAPHFSIWLLFAITLIWTSVYDTFYGMVDYDDDIQVGIKSTAILFHPHAANITLALQLLTTLLWLWLGQVEQMPTVFYLGILSSVGFFAYQQYLLRQVNTPAAYFKAFLNNQYYGAWVFAVILAAYWP